jgi:ATP-dependent helicase/nuclease subunit A
MSRRLVVPDAEQATRLLATSPRIDSWVAANAGSGKTTLLANRVIRLLLAGAAPDRILCLTFTKAAAAVMQARIFHDLARWVELDDAALAADIARISDAAEPAPAPEQLRRARTLFARAIEAPGGLKIQTIHAFAERVLHLAPIEAGVPLGFRVIDEAETAEEIAAARRATIDAALRPPESGLTLAFRTIVETGGRDGFARALRDALGLLAGLALRGEPLPPPEARERAYRQALGVPEDETMARIEADLAAAIMPAPMLHAAAAAIRAGKTVSKQQEERAKRFDALATHERCSKAWRETALELFLTKEQARYQRSIFLAETQRAHPELQPAAEQAADACLAYLARRTAFRALERSHALSAFAEAVRIRYEAAKRARSLLDFGDLIAALRRLLQDGHAAWLMMKLDAGIEHVLVDEAQDTTPEMWDIIRALTDDFFAGEGQNPRRRTLFVVGDEKQSIYSFQGADPHAFDAARRHFAARAPAESRIAAPVRLASSFRSVDAVLDAVDAVFATADRARGLGAETGAIRHVAARTGAPGLVELWPPEPRPEAGGMPAEQALAERIAGTIAHWLATGERHLDDGRPVRAGDILILVRRRNAFTSAMLRALKRHAVPVSGADRLKLQGALAVRDLLVIGEALLCEEDDLALATALRTPLFDLDEEELAALARGRAGSLRQALREKAQTPRLAGIAAALERLGVAARSMSPFAFFATLLTDPAPGRPEIDGRRAMLRRLGTDAAEPLDAFLDEARAFAEREPASLLAFIAAERRRETEIKRDLEQGRDAVRVMTIHGAKGLEAPIVFLADTCATPDPNLESRVLLLRAPSGAPVIAWGGSAKSHEPDSMRNRRDAMRQATLEEYRRLLYVGLTRAGDRLYIAGYKPAKQPDSPLERTWYQLVETGLADLSGLVEMPREDGGTLRRFAPRSAAAPAREEAVKAQAPPPDPPGWLFRPAPEAPSAPPPLRPSRPAFAIEPEGGGRGEARRRGLLIHRLLELLPGLSEHERAEAGARLALRLAPDLDHDQAQRLVAPLLALLARPEAQPLFGADARAEVGLAGVIRLPDGTRRPVRGRVDRLVLAPAGTIIADIKTGHPRNGAEDDAILHQMALYRALLAELHPGRPVTCRIVWTETGRIETLPQAALDRALARITQA